LESIVRIVQGFLAAALAIGLATTQAHAQSAADYPNRPITLIVPFTAGVSSDILFRGLAEVASKHLGQPIIIDNRTGASGTLGPAVLATMKPDGYTIGQIPLPVFRLPLMQKVTYDPLKDFTYIINLAGYQLGAVVKADSQFKKWSDVIDYARANPGKFTYATIGAATTPGVATALAAREAGVEMAHVPSKGGGESIAALLGGHVNMIVESPAWAPLVAAGQLRLLMVLGSQREKAWPDVPALKEVGYSFDFDSPTGLAGPKGMDPAIVQKLHDAFKKAYDDPSMVAHYEKVQFSRRYLNSADYTALAAKLYADEREALAKVGLLKKD
jgi:tripartite-type tricarboxylate transporter receptor subunit TctC